MMCQPVARLFLSTLSLRRATESRSNILITSQYFYPRSPYGERLTSVVSSTGTIGISIHALLTESDPVRDIIQWEGMNFYPRSPYGERLEKVPADVFYQAFLSTLSLRRATMQEIAQQRKQRISIHALLTESDD